MASNSAGLFWVRLIRLRDIECQSFRKIDFVAVLGAGCVVSSEVTDRTITALDSDATVRIFCEIWLGWVKHKICFAGSKMAQIKELDNIASLPLLTTCCVGAVESTAITFHAFVETKVLYTTLYLLRSCVDNRRAKKFAKMQHSPICTDFRQNDQVPRKTYKGRKTRCRQNRTERRILTWNV